MSIKYGIIGCGTVARVHAYHAQECGAELVAFYDPDQKQRELFYDVFHKGKGYDSLAEMFESENLDVVSVCSPPFAHKDQTIQTLKNEIHVLCEKPLAINMDDAQEMINTADKANKLLGIMLPRRFYSNSIATKKAIDTNALGDLQEVTFTLSCNKDKEYYKGWRAKKEFCGGGILMSQAIHSIDQLRFIFGEPIKVSGNVKITREYLEIEDEATAQIEFEKASVKLKATANSSKTWEGITKIVGERGCIVLDSARTNEWSVESIPKPVDMVEDLPQNIKPEYYGPGHDKVIQDFFSAVKNHSEPKIVAKDSIDALNIILNIYRSSELGGEEILIQ